MEQDDRWFCGTPVSRAAFPVATNAHERPAGSGGYRTLSHRRAANADSLRSAAQSPGSLYGASFRDYFCGDGPRIARALAEKAISQGLGHPTLLALSRVINNHRKAYYDILERSSTTNEISAWMRYFSRTLLDAQAFAQSAVDFLMEKTKYFDRFRGLFNERQEKVLVRMFREGPGGFKGGLSAAKYASLTGTSRASVTRDLQDLLEKKALTRTGELKGTRYYLNVPHVSQSHSQEVT